MSALANKKLIDLTLLNTFATATDEHIHAVSGAVSDRVTVLENAVPITESYTLLAENWVQDPETDVYTYSLEEDYPHNTKEIDLYIDDDNASLVQRDAFVDAVLFGSAINNVITVGGTVPTVDIPVILKVVTLTNVENS